MVKRSISRRGGTSRGGAEVVAPGVSRQQGVSLRLQAVLLAAFTLLLAFGSWAYTPVLQAEFINYDDNDYVYANPVVQAGLTSRGAAWAFTTAHASNYHPLTWLSHMLDVELFGLDPGAQHGVNLFFHLANTLLLFALVWSATGRSRGALAVAALWSLHPLHVESVAWISERKDVLSAFFFLCTLLAWVWYARGRTMIRYVLVCVALALGLLAKPMLVTTPCVLLLLDWWPLGRLRAPRDLGRLLLEKVPLFLLAGGSVWATLWAQGEAGALASLGELPLADRLANVPVAYLTYVWKTFWPTKLGVFYPFNTPPAWQALGALLLLLGMTLLLWRLRRRAPWGLMGWLWFLGTLLPVVGVVQVGGQAWADRYTYIPQMGLLWVLVWGAGEFFFSGRRVPAMALVVLCGLALGWAAHAQALHWRDSESLYSRTLAVTRNNYMIHYNLAVHYRGQERYAEAIEQYEAALRVAPGYFKALNNLAFLLAAAPDPELRDPRRAVELAEKALAAGGPNPALLDTLAMALAAAGDHEMALQAAHQAATMARRAGLEAMALEIESRMPLYGQGRGYVLQ